MLTVAYVKMIWRVKGSEHSKCCWQVVWMWWLKLIVGKEEGVQGIGSVACCAWVVPSCINKTPEKGGALHYSKLRPFLDYLAQAPSPPNF